MNADAAYALLEQIKDFLENYADINNTIDGRQIPNKAMTLSQGCDEMLEWLEKLP